ncbi:MAG: dihydroneopterin aldolase [Pseudomonadota bacterium]|jgi:dihydroneopterin aldolase
MNTLFARITDPAARLPGQTPAPQAGTSAAAPVTGPSPATVVSAGRALGRAPLTRVFIRDLVLPAIVGIYDHEKTVPQRLRVNLDMAVLDRAADGRDRIADVVSYEDALTLVSAIIGAGHVNLLETLAETIARRLLEDGRVQTVTIRLEKLDAFAECASVGIEITRGRG